MKDFIRRLLKERLSEVTFDPHFYERSEDRLWGKKPDGPASINAAAWAGDYVDTVDLTAMEEKTRKLYIEKNVPITQDVQIILKYINFLESINFKTDKGVAVVLWKSSIVHSGREQNPPGGTLLVIVRNNVALNMQWQPNRDVNLTGGKVTDVGYIVNIRELIDYVKENGDTTITTKDLNAIKDAKSGKVEPKKPKENLIVVNGSKYSVLNQDGDLVNKNNPNKIIRFDDMPEELQLKVLELMD